MMIELLNSANSLIPMFIATAGCCGCGCLFFAFKFAVDILVFVVTVVVVLVELAHS